MIPYSGRSETATGPDLTASTRRIAGWLGGLVLLAVFGYSTRFYQQFYVPKLIVFYGIAAVCAVFLATRRRLWLPPIAVLTFLATFLLVAAVFGTRSATPLTAFMQWSFYFGAALLLVALINLGRADRELLLKLVFAAALAQLLVVIPQVLGARELLPVALAGQPDRVFGTVGNQEFLATLLGCGFFLGLYFRDHSPDRRHRAALLAAAALLVLGLVLAGNKGALLFIGLYLLWRCCPRPALIAAIGAAALTAAMLMYPDSIKGRMLLWLAALDLFAQHLATGVGLRQFENHYLDAVGDLFSAHPALSGLLGDHTASALDAHNLVLHFGAELGIAGLLLALLLVGYVLRLAYANRNPLGVALLFLLFKSLYTVMLASITGMILFVLLIATLSPRRLAELPVTPRRMSLAAAPLAAVALAAAAALSVSDYHFQRGARLLFLGQPAQAVASLNRAVNINSENADAYLALAQASYLAADYAGMRAYLNQALVYRRNKDSYKIAAAMFYYAKLYDDAYGLYEFLHLTFPQHLTSMTKLAGIYMIRGDYDQAHAMAQAVLRADPRTRAPSDARNIAIARRIAADSAALISPSPDSPGPPDSIDSIPRKQP